MARGAKESGLNKAIEEFLENNETLQSFSGPMILLTVLFMIAILTSVSSSKLKYQQFNEICIMSECLAYLKFSICV